MNSVFIVMENSGSIWVDDGLWISVSMTHANQLYKGLPQQ